MGNYNGTVRCGICYARGHNKRTCPKQTERMLIQMNRWVSQAEAPTCGSSQRERYMDAARQQAEKIGMRTGTNPMTQEMITKRGPTRRCSYCKQKHGSWGDEGLGHTRRTCPDLKADKMDACRINGIFRAGVLENLRDVGIGVGALISASISGYFRNRETGEEEWDRRMVPAMIRRVEWETLTYLNPNMHILVIQRMDKMGTTDGFETVAVPYRFTEEDGTRTTMGFRSTGEWCTGGATVGQWDADPDIDEPERKRVYTLATVPGETINPPAGWESGESQPLIEHFDNLKG